MYVKKKVIFAINFLIAPKWSTQEVSVMFINNKHFWWICKNIDTNDRDCKDTSEAVRKNNNDTFGLFIIYSS